MRSWPADPRIGCAMMRFLLDRVSSQMDHWQPGMQAVLAQHCDERFRASDLIGVDEALGDETLPTEEEKRELAELNALLDRIPRPERAFLAAIAAAPKDDAVRLVYADWLTERGHPRGELLALALGEETPGTLERIRQLEIEHPRAILGGLARLGFSFSEELRSGVIKTARGFVTELTLGDEDRWPWALDAPEVALLEAVVTWTDSPTAHALMLSPNLRRLTIGSELFAQLSARATPLPVTHAAVTHTTFLGKNLRTELARFYGRGFANLRRFEIETEDPDVMNLLDELFALPFMSQIEELTTSITALGPLLERAVRQLPRIRVVSFADTVHLDYRVDVVIAESVAVVRATDPRLGGDTGAATLSASPAGAQFREVLASLPRNIRVRTERDVRHDEDDEIVQGELAERMVLR